jgi:cyclophilin family peptidyl-prolyl cis-trans isomerase
MNKISIYATVLAFVIVGVGWFLFNKNNQPNPVVLNEKGEIIINQTVNKKDNNQLVDNQVKIMKTTLHTNKGDITIELNSTSTPNTVANFVKLAKAGFYNGTKFHRVIKGFMNQGGDPFSKDDSLIAKWGTGGPGYSFNDEISADNHNEVGTIAMANSGPNTNGSQFFINVQNNNSLDGKHTVFGHVVAGLDVVMLINSVETDSADRPISPVIIKEITIE